MRFGLFYQLQNWNSHRSTIHMLKDIVRWRLIRVIEERIWVRREYSRPSWRDGWQGFSIESPSTTKDHVLRRDIRVEKRGRKKNCWFLISKNYWFLILRRRRRKNLWSLILKKRRKNLWLLIWGRINKRKIEIGWIGVKKWNSDVRLLKRPLSGV